MSPTGRVSSGPVAVRPAVPADIEPLLELLDAAGLPTAGVPLTLDDFFVAEDQSRIVGAVGLESYDHAALLRSAVVDPAVRGKGVGEALVRRVLEHAMERGVGDVYLLTTTAERYFPRFGFAQVARDEVPVAVRQSVEFREACPASAIVMCKVLAAS